MFNKNIMTKYHPFFLNKKNKKRKLQNSTVVGSLENFRFVVPTKTSNSYTQTLTKKKENMKSASNVSGIDHEAVHISVNKKRHKSAGAQSIDWRIMSAKALTYGGGFTSGFQFVGVSNYVGTVAQLMVDSSDATHFYGEVNGSLTPRPLLQLNPYQTNTGSGWIPSTSQPASDKLYLNGFTCKHRFQNVSNVAASIYVYTLMSKTSQSDNPLDAFTQAIEVEGAGIAAATFPAAGTNAGGTAGSNLHYFYGERPQRYSGFNKCWKTLNAHRMDLGGGAGIEFDVIVQHNLMMDAQKNILLNPAYTNQAATWLAANTTCNYPKGCIAFMVIIEGQLVNDVTGAANAVTTANPEILHSYSTCMKISTVKEIASRIHVSLGQTQMPNSTAAANQKFTNVEDDVDIPVNA